MLNCNLRVKGRHKTLPCGWGSRVKKAVGRKADLIGSVEVGAGGLRAVFKTSVMAV